MSCRLASVILLIIGFGCSYTQKVNPSAIIFDTVGNAIDKMTYNTLDSVIFIHTEHYPDNLKRFSLDRLKDGGLDSTEKRLKDKLKSSVMDSVDLKFKGFEFK